MSVLWQIKFQEIGLFVLLDGHNSFGAILTNKAEVSDISIYCWQPTTSFGHHMKKFIILNIFIIPLKKINQIKDVKAYRQDFCLSLP